MQRLGTRIFDSVFCLYRDESGFILLEQEYILAARDPCSSFYHYPVFSTPMMQLQGQDGPGIYDQPFHLKPTATVNAVVAAPRSKNLPMQIGLLSLFRP